MRLLAFIIPLIVFTTVVYAQDSVPLHPINGEYIREWLILGPFFPDDLGRDFLADFGGEQNVNPKEGDTVTTEDGRTLTWEKRYTSEPKMNLNSAVGNYANCIAYAFCVLQSNGSDDAEIRFGSDDGSAVWVNHKRVHYNPALRTFSFEQDLFRTELQKGANLCLVKVSQARGGWEFALRASYTGSAAISGRIADEKGEPIPDASVRLEQGDLRVVTAKTNGSGTYYLSIHAAPGKYALSATAGTRGAWRLGISLYENVWEILDLTLKEAISIQGRLLMLDGVTPHMACPCQCDS